MLVSVYTTCGLADHRRLIATALGARCNNGTLLSPSSSDFSSDTSGNLAGVSAAERSNLVSLFGPHMVTVAQDLSSPLLVCAVIIPRHSGVIPSGASRLLALFKQTSPPIARSRCMNCVSWF